MKCREKLSNINTKKPTPKCIGLNRKIKEKGKMKKARAKNQKVVNKTTCKRKRINFTVDFS